MKAVTKKERIKKEKPLFVITLTFDVYEISGISHPGVGFTDCCIVCLAF